MVRPQAVRKRHYARVQSNLANLWCQHTTAELVENKVLTAPKHSTGVTTTTNSARKRDYYHLWPKRVKDVMVISYEFSEGAFNIEEQSIIEKAMQDLARQVKVVRFCPQK